MKALLRDKWVWILFGGSIFLCWLFVGQYGIFGSRVDWVSQHSVLPDYFRQRFYDTGDLFPDFAWNLGAGQNIYNFSYYGLFNPVILVSYLLPFVRMDICIMAGSILCYSASAVLFYLWLGGRDFPAGVRAGTACMFALAAPLIYHSYNQLMFVNYMPFLCLALLGTDRYFRVRKRGMLLCGVCGMIFSSFYFSIGGLAALCIYAFGEYLWEPRTEKKDRGGEGGAKNQDSRRSSVSRFLKKGSCFAGNLILAVMLSGILLVPSFLSICSGRQESIQTGVSMKLAAFKPERFFYSAYGLGLSAFGLICLIAGVICCEKWRERWNSLCLLLILLVPAFGYLLNGGLYDKDKVFIPFLPLVCLEVGWYSSRTIRRGRVKALIPYILVIALVCAERNYGAFSKYWPLILADSCLMLLLFLVYRKYPKLPWPLMASCVILFVYGWFMNPHQDNMLSEEEYDEIVNSGTGDDIKQILDADDSFYRFDVSGNGTENKNNLNRIADIRQNITSVYSSAYNADYQNFRKSIFKLNEPFRNDMMQSATDNPVFLSFMGVKYLAAKTAPDGCQLLREGKNYNIYRNEAAAPIAYVTDQVMGEKEYAGLEFPANQTALLQRAIVPEEAAGTAGAGDVSADNSEFWPESGMRACKIILPLEDTENLTVKQTEDGYLIEAKKETEIQAELSGAEDGDTLLALIFDVENRKPNRDMYVRVQGQTNRLSAESHEYANHNTEFAYMVTMENGGEGVRDVSGGQRRETDAKQESGAADVAAGTRNVQIKLGPGLYQISSLKAFAGSMETLENPELYQTPVDISAEDVKGDTLTGNVSAAADGYLITSIPYDKNLRLTVDGEEAEVMRVNTAFAGAKITAGEHRITITYNSPGKNLGILLSAAAILLLCIGKLKNSPGIF